jgi:hypothetical protein
VSCNADGKPRDPAIATCLGLLPEQFQAFMQDGECWFSQTLTGKQGRAMCDAAEFNKADVVTSPFGVLGHDVVAVHMIAGPANDEERLFQKCRVLATANAPRLHREKGPTGMTLTCLDVRLDYAGMMHGDLWPEQLRAPGGMHTRNPLPTYYRR